MSAETLPVAETAPRGPAYRWAEALPLPELEKAVLLQLASQADALRADMTIIDYDLLRKKIGRPNESIYFALAGLYHARAIRVDRLSDGGTIWLNMPDMGPDLGPERGRG